jgi:phage terminase large subunit GpA-like protein
MEPMTVKGFAFDHPRDLLGATIADHPGTIGLICPHCGALIEEHHKVAMLRAGRWVPDGCRIEGGVLEGTPRDVPYATYWLIDRFSLRHLDEDKQLRLDMSTHVEHWQVLVDQVMAKAYPLADGSGRLMPIRLTACDSGGEEGVTDRAYAFYRDLRRRGFSGRFLLLKGAYCSTAPKLEERYPDTTKRKDRKAQSRGDVPVWFLNTDLLKNIVHNNLGRPDPGPGYLHWPEWLGPWFFDELTAEARRDTGHWERIGARNEAFDLYVYAPAALIRLGADRMDWEAPRPWALPWEHNPEILAGEGEGGEPAPTSPAPAARRVRFRVRG